MSIVTYSENISWFLNYLRNLSGLKINCTLFLITLLERDQKLDSNTKEIRNKLSLQKDWNFTVSSSPQVREQRVIKRLVINELLDV